MKLGRNLQELAIEVKRQRDAKLDIVAPTDRMFLQDDGKHLLVGDKYEFDINDLAHEQIATYAGIPGRYYNRMRDEAPDLLSNNVNKWFRMYPAPRMTRVLDGRLRAFLSDSYRPLENYELLEAALEPLSEMGVEIVSSEITEKRLYIKAVDKAIERDVPSGRKIGDGSHVFFDTVSPAVFISNSEVGLGALTIESGVLHKMCTNLAMMSSGMRKRHLGGTIAAGEDVRQLLTDETRRATDRAVWMQVRDVVKGAFEEAKFDAHVQKLSGLAAQPISGDPIKVVDLSAKRLEMNEGERSSVLRHLIEGGDLTRYGLYNAVTRTAQDLASYDRASEFERFGGEIVELPRVDWERMAEAA